MKNVLTGYCGSRSIPEAVEIRALVFTAVRFGVTRHRRYEIVLVRFINPEQLAKAWLYRIASGQCLSVCGAFFRKQPHYS